MTDKIDQNRKQIAASKKRIETLQNQESNKDAQLEQLKREIANLKKEKLDIQRKQKAEKRKNRTRAMIIFAGEVLKLFPEFESIEKNIYTLGEYQRLYNSILDKIKNSNIKFDIAPIIASTDSTTMIITGDNNQIVIPGENALKAITVSSDQKVLLHRAWDFLKNIFSEKSTQYSTQQINERVMYYVNATNPSVIIDDYQFLKEKDIVTIDDLLSLH